MPTEKKKRRTVRKASATANAQAGTKSIKTVTKSGKYKETRKYDGKKVKTKELSSKRRTAGGTKGTLVKQKTTYKKGTASTPTMRLKKTVSKGRVGSSNKGKVKIVTRRKTKR